MSYLQNIIRGLQHSNDANTAANTEPVPSKMPRNTMKCILLCPNVYKVMYCYILLLLLLVLRYN